MERNVFLTHFHRHLLFLFTDAPALPAWQPVPLKMALRLGRMLGPNGNEYDEDLLEAFDGNEQVVPDDADDGWLDIARGAFRQIRHD